MAPSYHERVDALEVLKGDRQADLAVTNGRIVDVWSGEIRDGGVAVIGETIIAAGPIDDFIGPETELIDAEGAFLTSGLIETHLHVCESNLNPTELARILLPHGTTEAPFHNLAFTAVCGELPFLKLAHKGLFDVQKRELLPMFVG